MLSQFLQVFRGYAWYEIAIEMAIIWLCVFAIYRSLRGTRGAGIIKGVALVLVVLALVLGVLGGSTESFGRIRFISSEILGLLAIVLAVVFQPELRQAMIRVGQTRLFNRQPTNARDVAGAVGEAVEYLAKNRFGSLVVIERQTGLVEGGVELDAKVSSRLLETIFYPNSALHDLAVVIRRDRIVAAGVQLPLPEGGVPVPMQLGSRHRAAMGLSQESDAVVVIVSEETGLVRIAERGELSSPIAPADLGAELERRLRDEGGLVRVSARAGGSS
ncbi:MAG: diadenylate cyclase [Phycisphaerales bacterium]